MGEKTKPIVIGHYYSNQPPIGWICPKCCRALAPFLSECVFCNDKLTVTISNTASDEKGGITNG